MKSSGQLVIDAPKGHVVERGEDEVAHLHKRCGALLRRTAGAAVPT